MPLIMNFITIVLFSFILSKSGIQANDDHKLKPPCSQSVNISSTYKFTKNLYKEIAYMNTKKFAFSPLSTHMLLSMILINVRKKSSAEELRKVLRLPNNNCTSNYMDLMNKFNKNLQTGTTFESETTISCKDRSLPKVLEELLQATYKPKILCPRNDTNFRPKGLFTNQLSFHGKWKIPFIKQDYKTFVANGLFYVGRLQKIKANFFIIPFKKGNNMKLILIEPDLTKELYKVERNLRAITYNELVKIATLQKTSVVLEKIRIKNVINLKPILRCKLGIDSLFAGTEKRGNKNVGVKQDAFLEVSENGTRFTVNTKFTIGTESRTFYYDKHDAKGIFMIARGTDYIFMGHY